MAARCSLRELHELAAQRGGRCLSMEYVNNKTKYLWECGTCLHKWEASWNNVSSSRSWCPNCRVSMREQVTRLAFQECFPGEEFAKNQTEIGMELDGFSPSLALAFEHDGVQHRKRVEYYQRTEEAFQSQQERDKLKDDLCDGVLLLVRVPDREILPVKDIRDYVRKQLAGPFALAPKVLSDKEFMDRAAVMASYSKSYIPKIAELAAQRGGQVTSNICPTRDYPVVVRCHAGHEFQTDYNNLERGRWCPKCAPNRKLQDEELAGLARSMGLEFLGAESRKDGGGKSRRYVQIRCPTHGQSEQMLDHFRKKRGCAKCSYSNRVQSKRMGLDRVGERLAALGLHCVTPYVNNSSEMIFVCAARGHQFRSSFQKVSAGSDQCPGCITESVPPLHLKRGPQKGIFTMTDHYVWQCTRCGQESETTIRGIKIRLGKSGHSCKNKNCPSRK